jgi:hypothetical protein
MSGERRKPQTPMRLRHWLAQLLPNVKPIMNVTIQKLNGLWHLIVGSCQIRTPFLETQDRALVVAYANGVYPGAKILERD